MSRGVCVRAYAGRLPWGQKGYEFITDVCPTSDGSWMGPGGLVKWCQGSPGVIGLPFGDMVCIPATITNMNEIGVE